LLNNKDKPASLSPHGESGLNLVDEKLCDSEMIYENFNIIDQNM